MMTKFIYRNTHNKIRHILVLFTSLIQFCIRTTEVDNIDTKHKEWLNEWQDIIEHTTQYFEFVPVPEFERNCFAFYCIYFQQLYDIKVTCGDKNLGFEITLPISVDSMTSLLKNDYTYFINLKTNDQYFSFVKKNLIRFECLLLNSLNTLKNYIIKKLSRQLDCTQDEFLFKIENLYKSIYLYNHCDFQENEICAINLLLNAFTNEVFDHLLIFCNSVTIQIIDKNYMALMVDYGRGCPLLPDMKIKQGTIEHFKKFLGKGEDIIQKINVFEKNYEEAENKFDIIEHMGMKITEFFVFKYFITMLKIRISKESKLINYIDLYLTNLNNKKVKEFFISIRKNISESFIFVLTYLDIDIDFMYTFYPSVNYIENSEIVEYNSKTELANVINMINKQILYCSVLFEFIRLQKEFLNMFFIFLDHKMNLEKYPDLANWSLEYSLYHPDHMLALISKNLSRIYYLLKKQWDIFDRHLIQKPGDLCLDFENIVQDYFMQASKDANMQVDNKIIEFLKENILIHEHKFYRILQTNFDATDKKIIYTKFKFDNLIKQLKCLNNFNGTEAKAMENILLDYPKQTDTAKGFVNGIEACQWIINLAVSRKYDVPYEDSFAFACYYYSLFPEILNKLVEIVNETNAMILSII